MVIFLLLKTSASHDISASHTYVFHISVSHDISASHNISVSHDISASYGITHFVAMLNGLFCLSFPLLILI